MTMSIKDLLRGACVAAALGLPLMVGCSDQNAGMDTGTGAGTGTGHRRRLGRRDRRYGRGHRDGS